MSFEVSLIVKPVLILIFVSLLALLFRRASASTLHGIWALGMVGVLALPIAAVLLPTIDLPVLPEAEQTPVSHQTEPVFAPISVLNTNADVPVPSGAAVEFANPVGRGSEATPRGWRFWLSLAWGLGSCIVFLGWILALLELRRWKRTSTPIERSDWLDLLAELRQELSVFLPVQLRLSAQSVPPMTWGVFRPIILIPAEATAWTFERRRVVLAHELGHVKRYDSLGQILCQCARGIYWFNPLVWYAAHRLHLERERACDDIVLRLGAKAVEYADHLVQIARGMNAGFSWTVVSMTHPSQLKARVIAILDPGVRRQRLSRLAASGFLALVVLLTVSAAVIQLTALASMTMPAVAVEKPAPPIQDPQTPAEPEVSEHPATALVEGRVMRSESEFVAGAAVELRRGARGNAFAVFADDRGKFSFKDVPPGEYQLAATAIGHVRSEYGQEHLNGPGVTITLRGGQEMKNVSLTMVATGAISGQIRGSNGLRAANVQVHALQYGYEEGRRVLKTVRVMTTNDRGEYRLYWLPPGNYILMAMPLVGDLENTILIVGGDGAVNGFTLVTGAPAGKAIVLPDESSNIPIFFPGTIRHQDASVLELRSGEDRTGIDMTLIRTQSFRVRGTLANFPPFVEGNASGPPTRASVRLEPLSSSVLERKTAPSGLGAVDLRTGAFEIRGVLPGSYNLLVTASPGGRNSRPLFARAPVEVTASDIHDVKLSLGPGFDVSGKITLEGGKRTSTADLTELEVAFNQNIAQRSPIDLSVFTARSLQPNRYQIRVDVLPGSTFNGYVKSIKVGETDIRDSGLSLDGPPNGMVEIVINLDGGSLRGTAVTGQHQPLANAAVVLIPGVPLRDRADLYKSVRSGADGTFKMFGITPGEYRIYGWSDIEEGAWRDPEFMKTYEDRGDSVRVSEGSAATIQVRVIQ